MTNFEMAVNPRFDMGGGQAPAFRYAIFSQQRTGSSWLCKRLINLREFGVPAEYLNSRVITPLAGRLIQPGGQTAGSVQLDHADYMAAVEKVRTSPSGRFGIKIQPNQLFPLTDGDVVKAGRVMMRYDAIIVLTRRDKLAQAVSNTLAKVKGDWNTGGEEPDVSQVEDRLLFAEVASRLAHYISEQGQMEIALKQVACPVFRLEYEQMVASPDKTLDEVLRFLGAEGGLDAFPSSNVVDIQKPPKGTVANTLRSRFLDYIEGRIPA